MGNVKPTKGFMKSFKLFKKRYEILVDADFNH